MLKKILLTIILISSTRAHGMELDKNLGKWAVAVGLGIGSYLLLKKAYIGWNLDESLINAIDKGSANKVRFLLYAGADVNAKNGFGLTPLHQTAWNGRVEVAKLLIEAGADVDAKASGDVTPLHLAAEEGSEGVAQLLIEAGANVNAENDAGWTPLHFVAQNGHAEVAQLLIQAGAVVNAENAIDETPLHNAAWRGSVEIAQLLIGAGAEVNTQNKNGKAPLHHAAFRGHAEVAQLLIQAGADVYAKITRGYSKGDTPLHQAAKKGSEGVAQLLIEAGAKAFELPEALPIAFINEKGHQEVWDLKSLSLVNMLNNLNNYEYEKSDIEQIEQITLKLFDTVVPYVDLRNVEVQEFLKKVAPQMLNAYCEQKYLEYIKTFIGVENENNETALDIALKRSQDCAQLLNVVMEAKTFDNLRVFLTE